MIARLRPFVSAAALAALLVSWTTGVWAAACMDGPPPPVVAMAAEAKAPAEAPHTHAMHAGMGHAARPAPTPSRPGPNPTRQDRPDAGTSCPMMIVGGGSCTGPLAGPPSPGGEAAAPAPIAYAPVVGVRDRLIPISIFHPPKG
jgi:hypothetical protein